MTPQEVFDKVSTHILKMKKRSTIPRTSTMTLDYCAYRGVGETKCAVGILIPDAVYTPAMEQKDVDTLLHDHGDVLPAWMGDTPPYLLSALQEVHDSELNWTYNGKPIKSRLCEKLTAVAERYGLQFTPPTDIDFKETR